MLLNADTLAVQLASVPDHTQAHDVLVSMINETVTTDTQTQTVQRVRVVDQTAGNSILAIGDLSEFHAVSIAGAGQVDFDLDSFGANTVPSLQVYGDGMTALAIDHAGGTMNWQVNGDGSGTAAGAGASVSFTGVGAVAGGSGNDVLHGPAADTTWQIAGPGIGSVFGRNSDAVPGVPVSRTGVWAARTSGMGRR